MRNSFFVGTVAFVSAVAVMSACGSGSREKTGSTAGGGTPAASVAPDLVQKAAVTSETKPAGALDTASKGVRLTLVLGEERGGFGFNAKLLSDEAKAKIDEMFTGKPELAGAHFEIEGHTDNLGRKDVNERVGLARAEAVRNYLAEKHSVPLDCINVISYGFEKPVGDNATEEGRAQNRRVVIKVLD